MVAATGCSGRESGEWIEVEPLDSGCEDAVCHVMVRLDAQTLEVLGYAVAGGQVNPVEAPQALDLAQAFLDEASQYSHPAEIDGPTAGIYAAFDEPLDFGGFALVGEESGIVVAGGGIVWAGRGQYWRPTEWEPAAQVELGTEVVSPEEGAGAGGGDCLEVASASEARRVALRSNLAVHLGQQGGLAAYTYLYTPTVGLCNPRVAEYLVVLTQVK